MALSSKSIAGIGSAISIGLIGITAVVMIYPLNTDDQKTELESLRSQTQVQQLRLKDLTAGSANLEELQSYAQNYNNIVPQSVDIESLSRSISNAATNVKITAFDFGAPESVDKVDSPKASLASFEAPFDIADPSSASAENTEKPTTGLQRVPVIITVEAGSVGDISNYLDSLANQSRLIYVMDVTSQLDNTSGAITATIYAYGYINNAPAEDAPATS